MDPLSLTAGIIAVIEASAQIIKLLRKLALLKELPPLALTLKNELSNLRLYVSATQKFLRQLERFALPSDQEAAGDSETLASVVRYLEKGNVLVIQLDGMLGPLLDYSLRPDVTTSKKWIKWLRNEKKLKLFKDDLHCFRPSLNSALGFLNLKTSTRLEAASKNIYNAVTKIRQNQLRLGESYSQDMVRLETILKSTGRIPDHQKIPAEHDGGNDRDAIETRGLCHSQVVCKPSQASQIPEVAASRGHGEICEILLHAGADPYFTDYKNRSAVDIAWDAYITKKKSAKRLASLLAFSSGEKYAKKYKMGLLHKRVLGLGDSDLQLFFKESHDYAIDEKDAYGQTALYWTALSANIQAVSDLLGCGADCNIKNNIGCGILTAALMSNDTSCVRKILDFGCKINYTDADGYTPLHHSCRYGLGVDIIKALLDRGADKNAKTRLGHSPLMIATFNKQTATAKFLIDRRADIDIQGKDGRCALHYAVMVGDYDTVRNLLQHRVNHRQKTNYNETLLHFVAERNGDLDMIRTVEPFGLCGIDTEDRSKPRMVTALQAAEKHPVYDKDWFRLFIGLISKVRLENLDQEHEHQVQRSMAPGCLI